jgi:hypothetical protein
MTTTVEARQLWSAMPGWGIVANLLPPEVIQARRVRVLRRMVIAAMVVIVVLSTFIYGYAFWGSLGAGKALAVEEARTSQLQTEQRRYDGLTKIQGSVAEVQSQVATLLGSDIAFPGLIKNVLAQLPVGASVSQLSVDLTLSTTQRAASADNSPLDNAGRAHIGTILLSGKATKLVDVSTFMDRLKKIPGILAPYPTSNQMTPTGATYSVLITITEDLLSHRFDLAKAGGK